MIDVFIDSDWEDMPGSYTLLQDYFEALPVEIWIADGDDAVFAGWHCLISDEGVAAMVIHFDKDLYFWNDAKGDFKKLDMILHEFGSGHGVTCPFDPENITEASKYIFKALRDYGKSIDEDSKYKKVKNKKLEDPTEEELEEIKDKEKESIEEPYEKIKKVKTK